MTENEAHRLALALESLTGKMETGFATVRGDINLLARAEHQNGEGIGELEERVQALEARRFPLPTIGGLMGVAGVMISVMALLTGK